MYSSLGLDIPLLKRIEPFSFQEADPYIIVKHCGFDPWGKYIMLLVSFKKIWSTFLSEAEQSDLTRDKCCHLHYFTWTFNESKKRYSTSDQMFLFDKDGVPMTSWYCPIQIYSKDKPDKLCVHYFVLADSIHYLYITWVYIPGEEKCKHWYQPCR